MPDAAKTPCRARGCIGYAVAEGYCAKHRNYRADMAPPREYRRYHRLVSYQESRAAWLMTHPLCATCGEPGNVLDHITPHKGDRAKYFDQDNWQTLCKTCHDAKTYAETRGAGSPSGGHLIVTMGAPGSGKSHYAARYQYVVSTDAIRAETCKARISSMFRQAFGMVGHHLALKRTVVLDTMAAHPATRAQALRIARTFNSQTTLLVFKTNLSTCIHSQLSRTNPVPEDRVREAHEAILNQLNSIQFEGWNNIEYIERNENTDATARISINAGVGG